LLAVVAHELRNPMAPLLMVAALIGRVKPAELPRLQGMIERQVGQLVRLVDDLVDLSRVSTGKLRLVRSSVDLNRVIDAAVEACLPAMDARRQTFLACAPELPLLLHGDAERLTQVLSNLLDNASKYTPVSGKIELIVTRHHDTVDIAVIDTGIGITSHALTQVFEPFVQESHAIGFNGDGLGIGLMLVRELIEAHGGMVVASSAGSGHGSTFLVTLPTVPSVLAPDSTVAPRSA
jgi:signal transduction histidine kinase